MRVVEITGYGGPDVLRVADVALPGAPGAGQVLVRVAAAGVNPVDWKIREGYMQAVMPFTFPTILGNELAGTVEAVGEGVTGLKVGDEVLGATGMVGAFAEYALANAQLVVKKPSNLSLVQAAAVPVAAATTAAVFTAGDVKQGTQILIHAASGGVGSLAVQFALARGAEVTALASSGNLDFVRGLGAQHVVDRASDYEKTLGKFDVVFDAYGPEAQERSWGLLKPGGILVTIVAPVAEGVAESHGVRATMAFGAPNAAVFEEVNQLIEAGKIKIPAVKTYPVAEAAAALAEVQAGRVRGKVVLTF